MRPSLAVVAATPVVADTPVAEEADTLPVAVVDMPAVVVTTNPNDRTNKRRSLISFAAFFLS